MKIISPTLFLLAAATLALTSRAAPVTVKLDTSFLSGGNYYLDFQLTDGSGTGDGSNTAVVSAFDFGGGSAFGAVTSYGTVTGDLSSSVSLTDTDPFTEFYQAFSAGSFLMFQLELTNHYSGGTPDLFGFSILDGSLFNLATYAPASDQFLTVNLDGAALAYSTYPSVDGIAAPTVSAVPDTLNTAWAGLLGLVALALIRQRKNCAV